MSQKENKDTSVRITKHIQHQISYLKTLLNLTSDDKRFFLEDAIEYAVDFTIRNDKTLQEEHNNLRYNIERGRIYQM